MANSELFIMGDPRFLSGGGYRNHPLTCDRAMEKLRDGEPVLRTGDFVKACGGPGEIGANYARDIVKYGMMATVSTHGQCIHRGRDGYHRHEYHPESSIAASGFNVFCGRADLPTMGLELETYCRSRDNVETMKSELVSNWFHFEEDGSLDRLVGHELITEPLPPRVYRDIATWIGLQNLVSPWLESYRQNSTGLHVHVGLSQFDKCDGMPADTWTDRRKLAQFACALVYGCVLGYALGDKVFLRRNGHYCALMGDQRMAVAASIVKNGIAAGDMFDWLLSTFSTGGQAMQVIQYVQSCEYGKASRSSRTAFCDGDWSDMSGHGAEVNFQHTETIEFRRGKGTTNAISVHRMAEFCTLVVRYVWKCAREPGFIVSPRSAYEYIIDLTTSEALRGNAEDAWSKLRS